MSNPNAHTEELDIPLMDDYDASGYEVILDDRAGEVILSDLPPLGTAEQVHKDIGHPLGRHLATVVLPEPSSIVRRPYAERRAQHRHLAVFVFDEGEPTGRHADHTESRYTLLTAAAIEQLGNIAAGHEQEAPLEGEGIIHLAEGDEHLVGRHHWLPGLGTAVELRKRHAATAAAYRSVSHYQGAFRVEDGELIWDEAGKNGSVLAYGDNQPRHARVTPPAPVIPSIFDAAPAQRRVESFDGETGAHPRFDHATENHSSTRGK